MNRIYLPALDGLRGLAALLVLVFHLNQMGLLGGGPMAHAAEFGRTGVDLFFVLSGFLITRNLLAKKEGKGHLARFYVRRALRLLPLYYLGLLVYLQVVPRLLGQTPSTLGSSWWFLVYLQNAAETIPGITWREPFHYWSLAIEEHFYLVWPWAVALMPRRLLAGFALALVFLSAALRWVFIHNLGLHLGAYIFTPCRLDGLSLGCILACAEAGHLSPQVLDFLRRRSLPLFLATGGLLVLLRSNLSQSGAVSLDVFKFSLISIFYSAALGWLVFGGTSTAAGPAGAAVVGRLHALASSVLSRPALRELGRISYGIYVFHPACIVLVVAFLPKCGPLVVVPTIVSLALLVSWISYHGFEKPLLDRRPDP